MKTGEIHKEYRDEVYNAEGKLISLKTNIYVLPTRTEKISQIAFNNFERLEALGAFCLLSGLAGIISGHLYKIEEIKLASFIIAVAGGAILITGLCGRICNQ
jgi:hypothetical protein